MAKNKAEKALKKLNRAYVVIIAVALVIGALAGYLIAGFIYGGDTLKLNGSKINYREAGSTVSYHDEGIKYVSGGKDLSTDVKIETNMELVDGKYTGVLDAEKELYIIYTVTTGRAKGQTLYRVFRATLENGGGA